jgi:predicted N-acetyltransferase YhbS
MDELRREGPDDGAEVEALYDTCFAPGRTALSSYRLREGVPPVAALCLLLRAEGGEVAAAIRSWPVLVRGARDWPALLLGPVAVHPTRQGEGLGGYLVGVSLDRAWDLGHARVLLVGDAPYYGRHGFRRLDGLEMPPPTNPDRVLGVGDWAGVAGRVLPHAAAARAGLPAAGEGPTSG